MKFANSLKLINALILALLLAGCATQPVVIEDRLEEVPQYPAPGGKKGLVKTYFASDGGSLAYVAYTNPGSRTALVYLHGIESHAGWFAIAASELQQRDFDVFCLDRRGSGLNQENRGFLSGHTDAYETLFADIDAFIKPLRDYYDQVFLVGLSWGGKLAMAYGLSRPQAVDGLVLITPGLRAEVDVSALDKLKIAMLSPVNPTARATMKCSE